MDMFGGGLGVMMLDCDNSFDPGSMNSKSNNLSGAVAQETICQH